MGIEDSYGDGICCGEGNGFYKVMVEGEVVASGGKFGYEECKEFEAIPFTCTEDSDCVPEYDCEIGRCDSDSSLCVFEIGNTIESSVEIKTDQWPYETTWEVFSLDNLEIVKAGGPYYSANQIYSEEFEICNGTHKFCIGDSWGDGMCCDYGNGFYKVMVNGRVVASGGEFGFEECKEFEAIPFTCTEDSDCVPMYDCEVGRCDSDSSTCIFEMENGYVTSIQVMTDDHPSQTSWNLYSMIARDSSAMMSGGSYSTSGGLHVHDMMMCDGLYKFCIQDSADDGICCDYGNGFYKVMVEGEVVASGGEFVSEECKEFDVKPDLFLATPLLTSTKKTPTPPSTKKTTTPPSTKKTTTPPSTKKTTTPPSTKKTTTPPSTKKTTSPLLTNKIIDKKKKQS